MTAESEAIDFTANIYSFRKILQASLLY